MQYAGYMPGAVISFSSLRKFANSLAIIMIATVTTSASATGPTYMMPSIPQMAGKIKSRGKKKMI